VGTIEPGKNRYLASGQTSNEVAIRSDWRGAEDLFVIADRISPAGAVYFKVFVKPLVNLIWLAGLVFLLGALVALWPDAREQRRLSERYADRGARTAEA
jgi:cytochrome c biogenesis factor